MFVTFITIFFIWPFLKLRLYRDTRAYILDLTSKNFSYFWMFVNFIHIKNFNLLMSKFWILHLQSYIFVHVFQKWQNYAMIWSIEDFGIQRPKGRVSCEPKAKPSKADNKRVAAPTSLRKSLVSWCGFHFELRRLWSQIPFVWWFLWFIKDHW